MENITLPVPDFFNEELADTIWQVSYNTRINDAREYIKNHNVPIGGGNQVALLCIDVQNSFCIPGGELFISGISGNDAVEDTIRLTKYIYRNLSSIDKIFATLDTHHIFSIFFESFWVNPKTGEHPKPGTIITLESFENKEWVINKSLPLPYEGLQSIGYRYLKALEATGRDPLIIWPYHTIISGIGNSLVSLVEEAIFFHSIARDIPPEITMKGTNPTSEYYSALRPEVEYTDRISLLSRKLLRYSDIIIAGQAKSHCVLRTIQDLIIELKGKSQIHVLEDCTSPVVIRDNNGEIIPGLDYSQYADETFKSFESDGVKLINSHVNICDLWG